MSKLTDVKQKNGKTFNENFRDMIINSKKSNLDISDVLNIALKVTNGDYGLAMATASNTLKSITYEMRGYKKSVDGVDSFFTKEHVNKDSDDFEKDLKMISKLGNLRKDSQNGDKMGMWYHFFNVQSMASYYGEDKTKAGITLEHGFRYLKPVYDTVLSPLSTNAKSPIDDEKASLDNLSFRIFCQVMDKFTDIKPYPYEQIYMNKGL